MIEKQQDTICNYLSYKIKPIRTHRYQIIYIYTYCYPRHTRQSPQCIKYICICIVRTSNPTTASHPNTIQQHTTNKQCTHPHNSTRSYTHSWLLIYPYNIDNKHTNLLHKTHTHYTHPKHLHNGFPMNPKIIETIKYLEIMFLMANCWLYYFNILMQQITTQIKENGIPIADGEHQALRPPSWANNAISWYTTDCKI